MNEHTTIAGSSTTIPPGRNFDVSGRVVVVTGGGQGIGRQYALEFAAAGAIPIIAELNEDKARSVAKEITDRSGRALAIATDVTQPGSLERMADAVLSEFGRIDVLVNNAGIFTSLKMKPFDQIPLDEWDQVINTNITGCFLAARAVLPAMRKAGWGRIINITSGAVPLGLKNYMHYVTSKSALVGMTNAMARELGAEGITVNAVQPGATYTEVPRETLTEEGKARLIAMQCIPRAEVPMDLVGLVMFLSTEASGFITGQTIACDGGLTHW